MAADVPAARLVLTHSRRMWHIAKPVTPYYTLCETASRPAGINYPEDSGICKRCQRTYDREVSG